MKLAAVYILSDRLGKEYLHIDATADLKKRLWAHENALPHHRIKHFPDSKLIYFEITENLYEARQRLKEIMAQQREETLSMIGEQNTEWRDLSGSITALELEADRKAAAIKYRKI